MSAQLLWVAFAALGSLVFVREVVAFRSNHLNRVNNVRLKSLFSSIDQIELFSKYHRGAWIGYQSMHDYTDEKVSEKDEIERSNIITGTCLDSQGDSIDYMILREANDNKGVGNVKKIASYEKTEDLLIGNKFINTLAIGGPLINTKNDMLSLQFTFAEENSDRRMKMCIIYETYDKARVPGTSFEIPETMVISDVIIIREKRAEPSLFKGGDVKLATIENGKDAVMWSREGADSIIDFEVEYKAGKRVQYDFDEAGTLHKSEISFKEGHHSIMEDGDTEEEFNRIGAVDDPNGITSHVKVVHAGGLLLEAPRTLAAGDHNLITIHWKRTDKGMMSVACVSFVAMQNAVAPIKRMKGGADAQYVQPQVKQIVVEELIL